MTSKNRPTTQSFLNPANLGRQLLVATCCAVLLAFPMGAQESTDLSNGDVFTAQAGPKKHQKRQSRPVKMGTSAGNVNDFVIGDQFITCCSGTAGALIEKKGRTFILSNNHVFAQTNSAAAGDPINQPGMLDNSCQAPEGDYIATLESFRRLKFGSGKNKVDVALAEAIEGMVDPTGEILEIGIPGDSTVNPTLGLAVQKAGRTTGLRRGTITVTNLNVFVEYTDSCSADANVLVAEFKNQFIVQSNGNKSFSAGGDSGSVIYEDTEECPRAAGLLFAGNDVSTVGSKMKTVLKQVKRLSPKGKATLVGCSAASNGMTFEEQNGVAEIDEREMRLAKRIQARTEDALFELGGVRGVGIGRSQEDAERPVMRVFIDRDRPELKSVIPESIDGLGVEVVESAPFRALNCLKAPVAGS